MRRLKFSRGGLLALLAGVLLATKGWGAEETNAPILQIESGGHTAPCNWVGFTPDGRQLVSAGEDKVVRVWDLDGVIKMLQQVAPLPTNAVLPKIPLLRSLRMQIGPGDEGKIYAAAISPKPLRSGGWLLAVGGEFDKELGTNRGVIRLLDLSNSTILETLHGHSASISALAFSYDGRWLASGSADNSLRVWDRGREPAMTTNTEVGNLGSRSQKLERDVYAPRSVAFIPNVDGRLALVAGDETRNISLWRCDSAALWKRWKLLPGHSAPVDSVQVSSDGRYIASASQDLSVRLWDAHTGKFLRCLDRMRGEVGQSAAIAFTPDSQALVCGAMEALGGCRVLSLTDNSEIPGFHRHNNTVSAIAVSRITVGAAPGSAARNFTLVASTGGDRNDIFLWDAATGRLAGHIVGVGRLVCDVAITSDSHAVGWSNANVDQKQTGGPALIENVFDLIEMKPSPVPKRGLTWRRALENYDGWTASLAGFGRERGLSPWALKLTREGDQPRIIRSFMIGDPVYCYSFVPERKILVGSVLYLALHDFDESENYAHAVKNWPQDGNPVDKLEGLRFIGHSSIVSSVATSSDGRLMVSGSADQTFRLWNMKTGELLLSVFVGYGPDGSVGEWVAWTPAGYYKSSPGGDKLIGWHLNRGPDQAAEFVAACQMRKLFEKPEIVELIPATLSVAGAVEQYQKDPLRRREAPVDVSEDLERLRPPKVRIDEPSSFATVTNEQTGLRARVWPMNRQPLTDIKVLVNGRPPAELPGFDSAKAVGGTNEVYIATQVPLQPGRNDIEVLAMTASAISEPGQVTVIREALKSVTRPAKPNCYVLSLGVSDYRDRSLKLTFAAEDARDIASAFRRQQGRLFEKVEARVMTDRQVSATEIKDGLLWLAQSVTQPDLAVVFISAHGWPEGYKKFYLAPHEFDPEKPSVTGFSKTELLEQLEDLPGKVLVVLDACYSGRVVQQLVMAKAGGDALEQVVKEFTSVEAGLVVIASSTRNGLSFERPEWGHGAMALACIEALTGETQVGSVVEKTTADSNGDGVLYVDELGTYMANRVKELTRSKQYVTFHIGTPRAFPVAVGERISLPAGDLTGARPKFYVRGQPLTIPLAGLRDEFKAEAGERLRDPEVYRKFLQKRYSQATLVKQNIADALEFRVEVLRGVVTREPTRWEKLMVTFSVDPDKAQVKVTCLGYISHVKSEGDQPPKPIAFKTELPPDLADQLRIELDALMVELGQRLRAPRN